MIFIILQTLEYQKHFRGYMLSRIIPLLSKYIPTALAFKGIQKVSPKLKNFATNAVASGYTADQVIGYLRSSVSGERNEEFGQRPEEQASKAQVENSKQLPNALQTGAALGGAALGGLGGAALSGLSALGGQEQPQNPMEGGQQIPSQSTLKEEMQNPKENAMQKFQQHQAAQQLRKMQQGHQPKQQEQKQDVDQALLAALQKILQM